MNNSFNTDGNTFGSNSFTPKVNPLDYPNDKCSACGNEVFIPGVIFKLIPGLELGQGKAENVQIPIKVFVCSKCGELSNMDKEVFKHHEKVKQQVTGSGLIL